MRQMKPPSHYLIQVALRRADGKNFFRDADSLASIEKALVRGATSPNSERIEGALAEISVACTRYDKANEYHSELVPRGAQVTNTERVRDAAIETMATIEQIDGRSWQRLILILGEDAAGAKSRGKSMLTAAQRQERRIDLGYERLNELYAALFVLREAADEALEAIPKELGRPAKKTAPLARSLVHELVDIWCRFHSKPYVAPSIRVAGFKPDVKRRADQFGAWFVETVIEVAGFNFTDLNFLQISKAVRKERADEWKAQHSTDNRVQKVRLQRDLNAGIDAFVRRRKMVSD